MDRHLVTCVSTLRSLDHISDSVGNPKRAGGQAQHAETRRQLGTAKEPHSAIIVAGFCCVVATTAHQGMA